MRHDPQKRPPRENLLRVSEGGVELRAASNADGPVMAGHFAVFNQWTEINSWEGNFLERFAPGAFAVTISENRESMRPLFQHGMDPLIGDKPLGPIEELREDEQGVYYEVPLLDAPYARDEILPGLEAGLYGASFRFGTISEEFNQEPGISADNPQGLPERTVLEAQVSEFGPVTFPAYAGASAGLRSIDTSELGFAAAYDRMRRQDADQAAEFAMRFADRTARPSSPKSSQAPKATGGTVPPWRQAPEPKRSAPRIGRPAEDIFDLSTVRYGPDDEGKRHRELRDRSMRAIERFKFPHAHADRQTIQGHLAELVEEAGPDDSRLAEHLLRAGSPRHRDAFRRMISGQTLTDDEKRTLNLSSQAAGGAVVPVTLDPTLIPVSSGVINPIRAMATTTTTMTDSWKGVTAEAIKSSYREEGEEGEDGSPSKIGELDVETESAGAYIEYEFEFGQDAGSVEPRIAALLQRSKDELEATAFLTGTGEKEPLGLLTAAEEVTATEAKETLTEADLEALEAALPAGHIPNAEWLGNREIYKRVRNLEPTGADIFVKVPGRLPEINGFTARELSTMAADLKGENKLLALADFSQFLIVDRIGMRITTPAMVWKEGHPTGALGIWALWRNATKLLNQSAIQILESAAE